MGRIRLKLALVAVTGLAAATLVAVTPSVNACIADAFFLETFDVSLEAEQGTYVVGETATVHTDVVRPASTDPLGQGIPIPAEERGPAEGVFVSVSLKFPQGRAFGWGVTDADGHAVIPVQLRADRIAPATANASAYAYASYPLACTRIDEYGYGEAADFLRATAPPA